MKKIDDFMYKVDEKVDKIFQPFFKVTRKYFVLISSSFLVLLLGVFLFKIYYNKPRFVASLVEQDIKQIHKVLHRIDKDCNILGFKGQRVVIDFLTVKKFIGSVIGGINLAYPDKWDGPYMKTNPTMHQHFYEIARTQSGYYIVPGEGVRLPNGYVVGRDFELGYVADIEDMMKPGGVLYYKGKKFAYRFRFKVGDWDPVFGAREEVIEEINEVLKEFNAAMPFSKNNELEFCTQNVKT